MNEKLIAELREESRYKDKATLKIMNLCMVAADALESLQAQLAAERVKYAELQRYNADCTKQFGMLQMDKVNLKNLLTESQRRERTGRWIDSPNIPECMVCSECLSDGLSAQLIAPVPDYYRYCPCCGAHMIGGTL